MAIWLFMGGTNFLENSRELRSTSRHRCLSITNYGGCCMLLNRLFLFYSSLPPCERLRESSLPFDSIISFVLMGRPGLLLRPPAP